MRVGLDRVDYRQILAVAFASILVFALYTPISAPFPSVMTFRMVEALSGVNIVVSDETTCQQIVLDNNSTATWSEEDGFVCTIGSDLTLDSDSSIRVSDGITLTIASGITLTNAGEVTIASGGTLDNQGTIENAGTVANIGMLANNGVITVYLDGDLENNAGTFTNNHIIIVNGTFSNIGGNITNAATGTITVNSSTTGLLNQGVFINNGTINNNGQIVNDNSFTNNGSIFNNCDSTFNGDLEEGSN